MWGVPWGAFKNKWKIKDGASCENSWRLKAINSFSEKFRLTIFIKSFILDVLLGSEWTPAIWHYRNSINQKIPGNLLYNVSEVFQNSITLQNCLRDFTLTILRLPNNSSHLKIFFQDFQDLLNHSLERHGIDTWKKKWTDLFQYVQMESQNCA